MIGRDRAALILDLVEKADNFTATNIVNLARSELGIDQSLEG